jgi:hypothetical protein
MVKPVIIATRASNPIVMNIQPINHTARCEPLLNSQLDSIGDTTRFIAVQILGEMIMSPPSD